jgi:hypothetical protein
MPLRDSPYNVPKLWFIHHGLLWHIARTNIADCTTECGVRLELGNALTRRVPPLHRICRTCDKDIRTLPYARGLQA